MFKISPTEEPKSLSAAKSYAFKLLSRRAYSCAELTQRLKQKGFSTDISQETVELLKKYGYINDAQLANREVERCLRDKKLGPKRIQLRLYQRGIDAKIIDNAMDLISAEDVNALCMKEAQRKLSTLSPTLDTYKKKVRLGNYLLRRGFDLESINKCLRKLI